MKKYKIKLVDVGRENVNKEFTMEFISLKDAEFWAYHRADNYLISSDTSLEYVAGNKYVVCAGFRAVGSVFIDEVKE